MNLTIKRQMSFIALIVFRFVLYYGLLCLLIMLWRGQLSASFFSQLSGGSTRGIVIFALASILAIFSELILRRKKQKNIWNVWLICGALLTIIIAARLPYFTELLKVSTWHIGIFNVGTIFTNTPWFYQAFFTFALSSFVFFELTRSIDFGRWERFKYLNYILFAFGIIIYSFLSIQRHMIFGSFTMDLGGYDQAIYLMSRFMTPVSTIYHIRNLLGDHFEPLLGIISPVYWIFKTPNAIFVLQAVAISLPVFPLFAIAKKYLKSNFAAFLISLSYLLFIGVQDAMEFDFHPLTFVPAALAYAFYFLDKANYLGFFISLAAGLLMKEVVALYVLFFGVYALVKKHWKVGLITILMGVFWYVFAINYMIPHLSGKPYGHIGAYHALGGSAGEILKTMITHPLYTLNILITPGAKIESIQALFGSGGFLALLSPSSLILALPMIGEKYLTTDREANWVMWWHYSTTIAIPIYFGAIMGLRNLSLWLKNQKINIILIGSVFTFIMTCGIAFGYYRNAPFSAPILRLYKRTFNTDYTHSRQVDRELAKIGSQYSVTAQDSVLPHVSHRKEVYFLRDKDNIDLSDYIIFDKVIGHWPMSDDDFILAQKKIEQNPDYVLKTSIDSFYLYEKINFTVK